MQSYETIPVRARVFRHPRPILTLSPETARQNLIALHALHKPTPAPHKHTPFRTIFRPHGIGKRLQSKTQHYLTANSLYYNTLQTAQITVSQHNHAENLFKSFNFCVNISLLVSLVSGVFGVFGVFIVCARIYIVNIIYII